MTLLFGSLKPPLIARLKNSDCVDRTILWTAHSRSPQRIVRSDHLGELKSLV